MTRFREEKKEDSKSICLKFKGKVLDRECVMCATT